MAHATPEEKLLNVIKKAQGKIRLRKELRLFNKVNMLLVGLIAIILVVFLIDLFTPDYKAPEINIELTEEDFSFASVKREAISNEVEKEALIPKEELLKDIALLGIVTGEERQAVIEDKAEKKTLFLYKGDRLMDFEVYDVRDGLVVLDYKGEKIELKI